MLDFALLTYMCLLPLLLVFLTVLHIELLLINAALKCQLINTPIYNLLVQAQDGPFILNSVSLLLPPGTLQQHGPAAAAAAGCCR
jgi:hypothetical protein